MNFSDAIGSDVIMLSEYLCQILRRIGGRGLNCELGSAWGRTQVEHRPLRYELKNEAVLWPQNALFAIENMHLREKGA